MPTDPPASTPPNNPDSRSDRSSLRSRTNSPAGPGPGKPTASTSTQSVPTHDVRSALYQAAATPAGGITPITQGLPGIPVLHHIYSSAGGYRCLHHSQSLAPLLPDLDAHARRQCKGLTSGVRWASLPIGDQHWIVSKTFLSGVDQVGRPRQCVHTIVFDRGRLPAQWPSFNPLRIPFGWFLTKRQSLEPDDLRDTLPVRQLPPAEAIGTGAGELNAADDPSRSGTRGIGKMLSENTVVRTIDRTNSAERSADATASASRSDTSRSISLAAAIESLPTRRDHEIVRTLMYAERGIILAGESGSPGMESLATLIDWLPLPYRLRWSVGTEWIAEPSTQLVPRQILLADEVAPDAPLPTLASGHPVKCLPANLGMRGVWDEWLQRCDGIGASATQNGPAETFVLFRDWFAKLPFASAPTAAQENWLLAAFRALAPLDPGPRAANKLTPTFTAQVAFGLLALGWGGQGSVAVDRLGDYGDVLRDATNAGALATLLSQLIRATTPRVDPNAAATNPTSNFLGGAGGDPTDSSARIHVAHAQLAADDEHDPHATVTQALWSLLSGSGRITMAFYSGPHIPEPDLRMTAIPWVGERRSLLWANVFFQLQELMASLPSAPSEQHAAPTGIDVALSTLPEILATMHKHEIAFVREHQWILNELSGPHSLPRRLRSLLEAYARVGWVDNDLVAEAAYHLSQFARG